jgi:hypothetical protein
MTDNIKHTNRAAGVEKSRETAGINSDTVRVDAMIQIDDGELPESVKKAMNVYRTR